LELVNWSGFLEPSAPFQMQTHSF